MATMRELIEEVYLWDMAPVSPDGDRLAERLCRELPFTVRSFDSGTEKNGWQIPNSWHCTRAEIRKDGRLVYDGRAHPLGAAGYSPSVDKVVGVEELKAHLVYSNEWPNELVFHCTHFFRPLERDWGFSVPKTLFDGLEEGEYHVLIAAEERPGQLRALEYTLPGSSDKTVFFHAHSCHPGQANDDLSGVAAGIEVMKRLAARNDRKFTYTLLVSPELYGSFFWLDSLSDVERAKLKYGVMLKSVGNDAPMKLQLSYPGDTKADLAGRNALRAVQGEFAEGPFRRVYGNDETIFEAPGYEIPTISFTRYPFLEYHTSRDTPAILSDQRMEETVAVLERLCFALDHDVRLKRHFKGLLGLSHPRYDLYQPYWNPAERGGPSRGTQHDWHYLMIDMFRDLDGQISLIEIAERHKLPFDEVLAYFTRFRDTAAITFID